MAGRLPIGICTRFDYEVGGSVSGVPIAGASPQRPNVTKPSLAPWRVTMVMPALNEGDVIRHVVARSRAALHELTDDFEIVVVDDGSTDATGPILDELADERVRVIHFAEHRRYGRALKTGIEVAAHPLVAVMDSDDQFDPLDLQHLLPL